MLDSLYSCFVITACDDLASWRLFGYGPAMTVPGAARNATRAHTNLLRSGDTGLPMDHSATIVRWRASTNLRPYDALLDWAATTSVVFRYNDKPVAMSPLLDILMAPQPILGEDWTRMIGRPRDGLIMRENIGFSVTVDCDPVDADRLRTWLVEATPSVRLTCWIWLEGEIRRGVG